MGRQTTDQTGAQMDILIRLNDVRDAVDIDELSAALAAVIDDQQYTIQGVAVPPGSDDDIIYIDEVAWLDGIGNPPTTGDDEDDDGS